MSTSAAGAPASPDSIARRFARLGRALPTAARAINAIDRAAEANAAGNATPAEAKPSRVQKHIRLWILVALFAMAASSPLSVSAMQTASIMLLIGVVAALFSRDRAPTFSPVFVGMALLLLASLVACWVNALPAFGPGELPQYTSVGYFEWGVRRFWMCLVLVAVLWVPAPLRRFRMPLFALLLASTCASVALAWVQFRTGIDVIDPRESVWRIAGQTSSHRARGAFNHPLTFAGYVALVGIIAVTLAAHARELRWRARLALGLAGMFAFTGLYAANSKGYFLVAAGALALLLFTLTVVHWRWLVPALLVLAAGFVMATRSDAIGKRFESLLPAELHPTQSDVDRGQHDEGITFWTSEADRVSRWYFAIEIIKDHPTFGVGRSQARWKRHLREQSAEWQKRTRRDVWSQYPDTFQYAAYHVHNTYLQRAVEMGMFGLGAFLLMWFIAFRELTARAIAAARARRQARDDAEATSPRRPAASIAWPLAVGLALIVFLAAGLYEDVYEDSELQCALWMLLGLGLWPVGMHVTSHRVRWRNSWNAFAASLRHPLQFRANPVPPTTAPTAVSEGSGAESDHSRECE